MHVGVDARGVGKPIAQLLLQHGVPVAEVLTTVDKFTNAAEALIRCRQMKVILPEENTTKWDEEFLDVVTAWKGFKAERDDEVDVLANACHDFTRLAGNMDLDANLRLHAGDTPIISEYNRYRIDCAPDVETMW